MWSAGEFGLLSCPRQERFPPGLTPGGPSGETDRKGGEPKILAKKKRYRTETCHCRRVNLQGGHACLSC
jgi:hypothetical protein